VSRILVRGNRYEVRTGGRGTAVLLVHGFTGRGADWSAFLPALRRSHTTVVVDLLGHGRSDAPRDPACHAIERQAADLAEVLRRLGTAPAVAVGYSMGARIVLRLAMDAPGVVSGLILESPSAGIADRDERQARRAADDAQADRIEGEGIEAFVASWEASPLFAAERRLPAAVRDDIRATRLRNRSDGLAASLRGAGQGAMEPLHDRLASIACPALVVAGDLDPVGVRRARDVAGRIPSAGLVVLPKTGHAPHREDPARFRHLLIDQLTAWSTA
jgi:2-succinyl-6-hydroxy-2,4-cyclohexadiene-1-carboxylate synthase